MNPDTIKFLFAYSFWTHQRVWACIEKLSAEAFERDLDYSWGSIRSQVTHVMLAEFLWLRRIQGHRGWVPFEDNFESRQAIRERWHEIEQMLCDYLDTVDEAELERRFDYQTSEGEQFNTRVADVLLHVVNHSTDHHAQILAMIAMLGGETVAQDMIYYVREVGR